MISFRLFSKNAFVLQNYKMSHNCYTWSFQSSATNKLDHDIFDLKRSKIKRGKMSNEISRVEIPRQTVKPDKALLNFIINYIYKSLY